MAKATRAELPPSFMDLYSASAEPQNSINIIGVVTDLMSPRKCGAKDWMVTFSIADWTHGSIGISGNEGLKVRFFKPLQSDLPPLGGTGDVVILRSVNVRRFQGMTLVMSGHSTTWTIVPAHSVPDRLPANLEHISRVKDSKAPALTRLELVYVVDVLNSQEKSLFTSTKALAACSPSLSQSTTPITAPVKRDKFSVVRDMQVNTYYDMVGQVVKLYPSSGRVDLYITDFTGNEGLYFYEWGQDEDGDCNETRHSLGSSRQSRKWPGPFGKMTLPVTLWPPHSDFAQRNVKENDFVHLRNLHVRFDRDTKVVGSLHEDRMNSDRIYITLIHDHNEDDRVKDVLRRKKEYHKKFELQSKQFIVEARGKQVTSGDETRPLTKKQARKKRNQERKGGETDPHGRGDQVNPKRKRPKHGDSVEPEPRPGKQARTSVNTNIHCAHHTIPSRPISSIVSLATHVNKTPAGTEYVLPFQNIKSRTTARVIDFFPHDLEDFAIPKGNVSEYSVLSDYEESENSGTELSAKSTPASTDSDHGQARKVWEWRFALILEDTTVPKAQDKAIIKVYVVGGDAECLLKLDAKDLRHDPQALNALREKLFLLWGNLEERKIQREDRSLLSEIAGNDAIVSSREITSRPFECCLKEYGVRTKVPIPVDQNQPSKIEGSESEVKEYKWEWERRWRIFGCTIT